MPEHARQHMHTHDRPRGSIWCTCPAPALALPRTPQVITSRARQQHRAHRSGLSRPAHLLTLFRRSSSPNRMVRHGPHARLTRMWLRYPALMYCLHTHAHGSDVTPEHVHVWLAQIVVSGLVIPSALASPSKTSICVFIDE